MLPLADLLEARLDELLQRWISRVGAFLAPDNLTAPELADHLPVFLREVITTLREPPGAADESPTHGWSAVGREHGAQRFRLGFELAAVVREYGLLLHLVLDLVESAAAMVSVRELRRLNDLFTNAVAEATTEYARRFSTSETSELVLARREADIARREAEVQRERLTNAFTQAPVAVGILRGDDNLVVLANEALCRIWGAASESLLDRPIFDILVDAKKQGFPELLAGVRRTRTPVAGREATVTLPRPGGGTEDILINFVYQPLREADGSVTDILVVATDVTIEVLARRAAEAASAEFEAMFNSIGDGVYLGDAGGVRRANAPGLAMLGVASVDELRLRPPELSKMFSSRLASTGEPLPPDRANFVRGLRGESFTEEYLVWHPIERRDLRIRSVVAPVRVGDTITGAVVLNTDVTEQHRALEAIQRSEESFRTLAEAIPQQVWTSRPDGTLDFVNQRVLDYFASSSEQVLGAGWQAMIHPDDLAACIERWTHCLTTGAPYEIEFRLRRADGEHRWHLGRARAARGADGTILKWFGTNTDVDDAKRVREELEKRTHFEQHLLGIVSHDLRNPLGAILLGATGLLELDDQSDFALKIALRIRSSAERSVRMISDLLDFTQARLGGGIRLEKRAADLHALTSAAVEEIEATHPDRAVQLLRAGDTGGVWDADRIAQVVTNLVTNALKYSPSGTPVAVRVAGHDGHVELAVHNEGPPIPGERLGRIFEPLQRATDQIDLKTRSVGLGLYIVEAIALAHGGTVGVVSTAEAGTTFTVRLPR
jgi:PAS domain S-box-containing protein